MKKILFLSAMCLVVVNPLNAQNFYEDFTGQVGAGFTLPVGQFDDRADVGFNFNANAGPRFNSRWSLLFDFTWNKSDLHTLGNNVNLRDFSGDAKVWGITVNPEFEFVKTDGFSSYAMGGYGVDNRTVSVDRAVLGVGVVCDDWWGICTNALVTNDVELAKQSTYKGGWNAGAGVTFGTGYKFFAEVRYHHVFTTNQSTQLVPFTFGVRF